MGWKLEGMYSEGVRASVHSSYRETNYLCRQLRKLALHKHYRSVWKSTFPGKLELVPRRGQSFCLSHCGLHIEESVASEITLEFVLYEQETVFVQNDTNPRLVYFETVLLGHRGSGEEVGYKVWLGL